MNRHRAIGTAPTPKARRACSLGFFPPQILSACRTLLLALLLTRPCLAAATPAATSTPAPSTEQHAGKPILRDDSIAAPGLPSSATHAPIDFDGGRVAIALAAVIALIFLLRWGGRKFFPIAIAPAGSSVVKVLARCPLAPRQQILLLQIGRRLVVVANCSQQLTSLCQITDADEVAALIGSLQQDKSSPASAFTSWFSHARDAFAPDDDESDTADPKEPDLDVNIPGAGEQRHEIRALTAKVRDLAGRFGEQPPI